MGSRRLFCADKYPLFISISGPLHVRIQRGGGAGGPDPPPWKITNNIGFLGNTGPEPLKITKLPIQHAMLGQAKCHLNYG